MKHISGHKVKKIAILLLLDLCAILLALLLAHVATFGRVGGLWNDIPGVVGTLALTLLLFALCGLYRMQWKNVGFEEMLCIFLGILSSLVAAILFNFFAHRLSVRELVVAYLILFNLVCISRYWSRFSSAWRYRFRGQREKIPVMIVGGGDAGITIIREMKTSDKISYMPLCVIDDDPAKQSTRVCGVPVVGTTDAIEEMAAKYGISQIFVAMPAVSKQRVGEICEICARTGRRVRILPGVYQMLNGTAMTNQMRDINIEDLLGRDPITVNTREVFGYIENKSILVTGGGGSIGSELCRQIAAHNPAMLTIFDIYENNAYEIEMELRRNYPYLNLKVLIGSVRDEKRVNDVFRVASPHIVFHAAAHKHVPLMEHSPAEAVKNNVFGTYNVAKAAMDFEVERFVMISTDKAVNPTNVMGATKRICEMIVQSFSRSTVKTDYVAVRFGNVLGSNGSVIPLFKRQIAEGGPVTVTHKDIIRYFMTIPEAVSLVLQAGAYATGGEIFVLDMGEPVKILTLAENLIRLSGYKPYEEINIVFTGLRPGEKLYEELLMNEEGMQKTPNQKIYIGQPICFDSEELSKTLDQMREAASENNNAALLNFIKQLVPTYRADERTVKDNKQ